MIVGTLGMNVALAIRAEARCNRLVLADTTFCKRCANPIVVAIWRCFFVLHIVITSCVILARTIVEIVRGRNFKLR
jgi:RNA polymerase subunit RPABC4/transcription elongation factor Spt4